MNNTKKKKHPIVAVMAGALAVYGAYSMVAMTKRCVCDKMSCMMSRMKKHKCEGEQCCEEDTAQC